MAEKTIDELQVEVEKAQRSVTALQGLMGEVIGRFASTESGFDEDTALRAERIKQSLEPLRFQLKILAANLKVIASRG